MAPIFEVDDKVILKGTDYKGTVISYEEAVSQFISNHISETLLLGEVFVKFSGIRYPTLTYEEGIWLWRGPEWMLERVNEENING